MNQSAAPLDGPEFPPRVVAMKNFMMADQHQWLCPTASHPFAANRLQATPALPPILLIPFKPQMEHPNGHLDFFADARMLDVQQVRQPRAFAL